MSHRLISTASSIVSAIAIASMAAAADAKPSGPPAIVSHVKIVSDKIEDVSSLEAWKKSFITEGMTDEQKALKIWESVVKFRQQSIPANEFLLSDAQHPHDFIKVANVYGYGQCCCASSHIEELSRYLGLKTRGWGLNNHSVPEVFYNDAWHMLDASLVNYYVKDDKAIASVEEMTANPEGIVNKAHSPHVDENGWYPAKTHQVQNSPDSYRKKGNSPFLFDYGYSQSYEQNVQLRDGERLTRNFSNKGLHVNALEGGECWHLKCKPGEGDLVYSPKYGDIAPGRVGNGTHVYEPPLGAKIVKSAALACENLATTEDDKKKPALHVIDGAKPASFVVRMPSSYVYLTGSLAYTPVVGKDGKVTVSYSDNNGLDWKEISSATASGAQTVDLKALVHRKHDYRLKFDITGDGSGLDALSVTHDVQHSQRALPALGAGKNTIAFSSGAQEGRIAVEGNLDPSKRDKNVVFADFHPVVNGLKSDGYPWFMTGGSADVTIPVTTPGDMKRISAGGHYRARGAGEGWDYQVSFDNGKTFTSFGKAEGPCAGASSYATYDKVPAGTRSALLKLVGKQNNTCGFFHIGAWADYTEPNGGFRPVKVTYQWQENGQAKEDVHIAAKAEDTWTITCAAAPTMTAIVVELAPAK
ncbi:MAG: hypothetical protein H0V44_12450 [Planctomycetes bacterium]|nr:hypothetical protein [Planctomycetota bacterium]